jgi:ubiquinone/menaquinone biosynthesis C-methylase UbiE
MKINMGCGTDIKKGYLNVDIAKLEGVDKLVNLNKYPLPFKENSVDEIYLNHVLAHLDDPTTFLGEVNRILKKGGKIIILVPHFTSATAYWGGVRKHQFSWATFQRYTKTNKRGYYFNFSFSRILVDFQFQKKPFLVFWRGGLLRLIANKWPYLYEMTSLQRFPCRQMQITMIK